MKARALKLLFLTYLSCNPYLYPMFALEEDEPQITFSFEDMVNPLAQILNIQDKFGKTLVGYAIETQNLVLLSTLLVQNADPNAQTHGRTPLILAVELNAPEVVNTLLLFGAKDADHYDLFAMAIKNRSATIISSLVRAGFDINARSADDSFALVDAVLSKDETVIETCLKLGADREMRDGQNRTAYEIVLEFQKPVPGGKFFSNKHLKAESDSIVDDRVMSKISDKEIMALLERPDSSHGRIERAKEIAQQLGSMPVEDAIELYATRLDSALQKDVLLFVPLHLHARIKPSVLRKSPVSEPGRAGSGCCIQ